MVTNKHPLNKPFLLIRIGSIGLFVLFFISKLVGEGGLSEPPINDYIVLLGIGIGLSITTITYTYYSWTLDAKENIEWLESQKVGILQINRSDFSKSYLLWSMRLFSPIFALVSVLIIGSMLFSIYKYFFR